jgi:hypothetical protein
MGEGDTIPLQPLCGGLQSDSVEVRVGCAYAAERVSDMHPPCTVERSVIALQAVGLIDAALADSHPLWLTVLSSAMAYLSPEIAASAVDDLVERFRQGTENARYVLASIGPYLGGRVFRWIDRLDDGSVTERVQAATVLGLLGTSSPPLVHALARHLDDDEGVAVQAATALQRIGPSATSAVPALVRVLHSSGGAARQTVARALVAVSPERAEAEAKRLKDTDPEFAAWFSREIVLSRL